VADAFVDKGNHHASEALEERSENPNHAPKVQIGFIAMYLSHVDLTMPKDGEAIARWFYSGHLGLREMPKPKCLQVYGGLWFDAGGLALHLSVEENYIAADTQRHVGLGCGNVDGLKARLEAAGVQIEDGPPVPWKRFFIRDPFGNRIEIHAPGGPRV